VKCCHIHHIQECLSGAHIFLTACVNQSSMVTVHVSSILLTATKNLDCILTDRHVTVRIWNSSRTELEHWFCGPQLKFQSICTTENDQICWRKEVILQHDNNLPH